MNYALPDSQLFVIDVITDDSEDINQYLTTREVPMEFTSVKKQTLIQQCASFTMIGSILYKLGKIGVLR